MKIGIMTLWGAYDNYGQHFQVYALQHFLRENGHDAFIIRYEYKKDVRKKRWYEYIYTLKYLTDINFIKNLINKKLFHKSAQPIERGFDDFAEKYIKFSDKVYHNIFELQQDPPVADIYITGSDQVWNFSNQYKPYSNKIQAFFLNFGKPSVKRVGYSVSFGRDNYGKSLRNYVIPFLEKFDFISCREYQGVNICKSMNKKSVVSLDPVFLNNKNDYLNLIKDKKPLLTEKFCVIYLLGNSTKVNYNQIKKIANDNNCKIVFIPGKGLKQKFFEEIYPNPTDWLWYMTNAEFIITNSFHGTAFSIILNKKFAVIPLNGKNSEMQNDRILTMFDLLKISKQHVGVSENFINIEDDWDQINTAISNRNNEIGLINIIKGEK